jgi:hypothetical protein
VRIYGLRHWTGQSYQQVKDQLGWSGFQVRFDTAIRHQALADCAFSFCWDTWFRNHPTPHQRVTPRTSARSRREWGPRAAPPPAPSWPQDYARYAPGFPLDRAAALVAGMVEGATPSQALMHSVAAGRGLHIYIPINKLPLVRFPEALPGPAPQGRVHLTVTDDRQLRVPPAVMDDLPADATLWKMAGPQDLYMGAPPRSNIDPSSSSRATMAARDETPSLEKTRLRWDATVQELMSRTEAIVLLG